MASNTPRPPRPARPARPPRAEKPAKRAGYKKSEDSRRQVLDAAIATLAERGLASTSIQDIADAAGLSKGAVHYHFESKDELLQHVLGRCCESVEERVRAVFDEPGSPMDRVRRAIYEMWVVRRDGIPEMRVLSELHMLSRQNVEIRDALGAAMRKAREQIIEVGLNRLIEMGLRPRVSLSVAPRLILATLDGLSVQHEIDPIPPEEEGELLRALEATSLALFEI
ncbi:MAG TPA: TetR/AcrR family transcriptional regulator [Labilithrix sp.]|nr:TetR/AcrR family transcriptional regulator [Labilithrix sp.]